MCLKDCTRPEVRIGLLPVLFTYTTILHGLNIFVSVITLLILSTALTHAKDETKSNPEVANDFGIVVGAVYDKATDQLFLLGDGSYPEASPGLQQIAIALQWAIADRPEGNYLSLDPIDPNNAWMRVRINAAAQDTDFGWIMFEADRLLKSYSLGSDTVVGSAIRSSIPDFQNQLQLISRNGKTQKQQGWSRFWLYPRANEVETSSNAMRIKSAVIGIKTETMRWQNGKLVSAPGFIDPISQYFAEFITEHYVELADEALVFRQLEQLLRLLLVSEWVRKEKIPISLAWIADHSRRTFRLPRITPGRRVSKSKAQTQGNVRHFQRLEISGGVGFDNIKVNYVSTFQDFSDRDIVALRTAAKNRTIFEDSVTGKQYRVAALPTGRRAFSPQRSRSLMQVALPNSQFIRLHGQEHSPLESATGAYAETSVALPALYAFNPHGREGSQRSLGIQNRSESNVPIRHYELYDTDGTLIGRFEQHEIDQDLVSIVVLPTDNTNPWKLYPEGDEIVWALGPTRRRLAFDAASGKLIGERLGDQLVRYQYNNQGQPASILAELPDGREIGIHFEHGSNGHRLLAARSTDGQESYFVEPTTNQEKQSFKAYNEGGESATVTIDPVTGDWHSEKLIAGLDYLNQHGITIARRSLAAAHPSPWLIPDGSFTLLVTNSVIRPLAVPVTSPRELLLAIREASPKDNPVIGIEASGDGRTAVLYRIGDEYQLEYLNHVQTWDRITGSPALEEFQEIERRLTREASTDELVFIHVASQGSNIRLQIGKDKHEQLIAVSDLRRLIESDSQSEADWLDSIIPGYRSGITEIVIYRSASDRYWSEQDASGGGRGGAQDPPGGTGGPKDPNDGGNGNNIGRNDGTNGAILLAAAIQSRDRTKKMELYLDDETEIARQNWKALNPIKGPNDIAVLIPKESFKIQDHDFIKGVQKVFEGAGIKVVNGPSELGDIPNVIIISGHNDTELIRYLQDLGERGVLRDKVILLNTCYADSNADRFHEIISKYAPKAILHHGFAIRPFAVQAVMREVGDMLSKLAPDSEGIHPADLMPEAAKRALFKARSENERKEILKLKQAVLQISWHYPFDDGNDNNRVKTYG